MQSEPSKSFERQWIAECAHRLRLRWPRVPVETLEEVAAELMNDHDLRDLGPIEAAAAWLSRADLNRRTNA